MAAKRRDDRSIERPIYTDVKAGHAQALVPGDLGAGSEARQHQFKLRRRQPQRLVLIAGIGVRPEQHLVMHIQFSAILYRVHPKSEPESV